MRELTWAYRGNFSVPFSTESHVAASIESLGHRCIRIQESEVDWSSTVQCVRDSGADIFLWTSTWGMAHQWDQDEANRSVEILNELLPTAAFHLDLFWGLDRATQPLTEPWFRLRTVFTADGGHDELWEQAGVNHHWLPPGVYHAEAYDGTPRREYTSDVAFVGSWRHYGHAEHHPVRQAMLHAVERKFGRRLRKWPLRQAVRGTDLTDLYASTKVVIGDSCLAGYIPNYWSDRVAETTGRGGFLIHPYVPGILNIHPDLVTYVPGQWSELIDRINHYLSNDTNRELGRKQNAEYTREHNTYRNRVQSIIDIVGIT